MSDNQSEKERKRKGKAGKDKEKEGREGVRRGREPHGRKQKVFERHPDGWLAS